MIDANMRTVKEFLRMVREAPSVVARKERECQQLIEMRTRLESTTQAMVPDRVQSGGGVCREDLLVKMIDKEMELTKTVDHWVALREMATTMIDSLTDERSRQVLTAYYLEHLTWEQVAVHVGYSWRHVHRIHGEALQELSGKVIRCHTMS
jgi:DNA-directed RNA polymerase specialized sigma subunit